MHHGINTRLHHLPGSTKFGLIKLGEPGRFIIDAYPVAIRFMNFVEIFFHGNGHRVYGIVVYFKFIIKKYLSNNQTNNP
jgi:hypothetical protein